MSELFQSLLLLTLAVTLLGVVAKSLPVPLPVTMTLGGLLLSFVPGYDRVELDPELFFIAFLPPLLFADGWLMPLRELKRVLRTVATLSVGLVLFTILVVGVVAHALIPGLPWSMAFALGAVVSPTDAVTVGAVTARLKVPQKVAAVLNGESLMNDATGLVAFRFALAATAAGSISLAKVSVTFAVISVGGLGLGLVVGYCVGKVRDLLISAGRSDPLTETSLSLMTPFAAYMAAAAIDVSPILSVVAAGLYSGWRDPVRMDPDTRHTAWAVWSMAIYWLNGTAFLLLGLSGPAVLRAVWGEYALGPLLFYAFAVSVTALLARVLWTLSAAFFERNLGWFRNGDDEPAAPGSALVVAWAGMRGAVTLAAALSIPYLLPSGEPVPGRDIVIFLALAVVVFTLIVHGTTLAPLIRWLGLQEEKRHANEERMARVAAVSAGLEALERSRGNDLEALSPHALEAIIMEYQHRLAMLVGEGDAREEARTRVNSSRRLHLLALTAERKAIDRMLREGTINEAVHRPLQIVLDYEEGMLRNGG